MSSHLRSRCHLSSFEPILNTFILFLSLIYEQLIFLNGALLLSPECKICVGAKVQRPEDNIGGISSLSTLQ